MMHVDNLVIGAGISGLTTAHVLKQNNQDVLLLESKQTAGGNIQSQKIDGWLVEEGPNSLLVNRQQVLDLFNELGLDSETVLASDVAKNRFILRDGKLHALPGSPFSFMGTKLFSFKDKIRLFKEPWIAPAKEEETVAQFVTRRLGIGFYDYAINPFVSGVYAGDPHQLSARAATKKVYALEEKHGSLVKGALAMVLGKDRPEGRISGRMLSFLSGMAALPQRLAQSLGDRLLTSQSVQELTRNGNGKWQVRTSDREFTANRVVLSCPSTVSARLLDTAGDFKDLQAIDYVPIAVCHLGFKKSDVRHPLNGFGCLIPRKENVTMLGALFSSSMFPGRTPDQDHTLITCFIGGATFRDISNWEDEQVKTQVLSDLDALVGVQSDPVFTNLVRYERSIPQYTMGHLERMASVQQQIAAMPGLSTRANWHDGISVSDCILNSMNHARSLVP